MHDRCCFFPNLKPFSVVVSWIRQEKSASAVFLLTSYWLSFLGLLTTTHHSQVNRLQLADDPIKQLVLSRHHFLLRKRLTLPPGSEQSSLGLVGPRTYLEKKEGTKQTLKRRMSNDCSTQATVSRLILLERHCFSAKRHSHQHFPTSDAASDAQTSRVCVSCHGKAHDSDADAVFLP